MAPTATKVLETLQEHLEGWKDGRICTREDILVWYKYIAYLVNLLESDGIEYRGHSLKNGSPLCLLVTKVTLEGTPYVVFTSGRTTTDCMRIFLKRLEERTLELRPDRFG